MLLRHQACSSLAARLLLAAGCCLLSTSLWANEIEITVEPSRPTPFEAIQLHLDGPEVPELQLIEVRQKFNTFVIELDAACPVLCPPDLGFELDIVLEPIGSPGTYFVRAEIGDDLLGSAEFEVQPYFLAPRVFIEPRLPDDNDALQAVVTVLSWGEVEVGEIRRQGPFIDLALSVLFPPILPPPPEPDVLLFELGDLEPGSYTFRLFMPEGSDADRLVWATDFQVADGPDVALLMDRFEVAVRWMDFVGAEGVGRPVPGASEDSVLFSFFARSNWELMVKVLDGCNENGHFWVLTGGATDLDYEIEITDTVTGATWQGTNALGNPATAVSDNLAFVCP